LDEELQIRSGDAGGDNSAILPVSPAPYAAALFL